MPKFYQGRFRPKNPKKYRGDPTNIIYRSGWELRCMINLDNDSSVLEWGSEELVIPYLSPIDGEMHRYFPDFVVRRADGVYVIEIKPFAQTQAPVRTPRKRKQSFLREVMEFGKNSAKWNSAKKYCAQRGWKFTVLTERELGIKF